ncbi:HepT-like ribonuclease domain-containing protein [Rhodothermus marinus]
MACFRNVLVHMYWSVAYEHVYEVLQRHLEDLRAFVRVIGECV